MTERFRRWIKVYIFITFYSCFPHFFKSWVHMSSNSHKHWQSVCWFGVSFLFYKGRNNFTSIQNDLITKFKIHFFLLTFFERPPIRTLEGRLKSNKKSRPLVINCLNSFRNWNKISNSKFASQISQTRIFYFYNFSRILNGNVLQAGFFL